MLATIPLGTGGSGNEFPAGYRHFSRRRGKKNDWSRVRVWDVPSGQFGTRIYAISGFILKPLVREASNN
jgi:hypothetical protein